MRRATIAPSPWRGVFVRGYNLGMSTNPLEPQQPPLKPIQVAKRAIGVGTILLLTPVAVGIAGLASCGTVQLNADSLLPTERFDQPARLIIGVALQVVPPLLVLIAMLWWAFRTNRRQQQARAKGGSIR